MKVSYNWLNNRFFEKKLPPPEKLAELFTMYSFEVERVLQVGGGENSASSSVGDKDDTIFDIKVLPNRSHDCLSHKGIARELSVLLSKKLSYKPEKLEQIKNTAQKTSNSISLSIEKDTLCYRASKRMVFDVKVDESPEWLKKYLAAVGQKSINNVVDCANFVMLETGQPVHTFDFDKISGTIHIAGAKKNGDAKKVIIRNAKQGETVKCLDGKEYTLTPEMVVIADEKSALDIAGIKGGMASGIDSNTKKVLISACNFDAVSIRKTSKKLGLRTDASVRFENEITPELVGGAVELLSALLEKIAQGKVAEDVIDIFPRPENQYVVGASLEEINRVLGGNMSVRHVSKILEQAGFEYKIVDPIKEVVKLATTFTGVPYKWGASVRFDAPRLFDCSSFVSYLYAQAGVQMPRMTIDQYVFGEPVELKDLAPGDLLFYSSKEPHTRYKTLEFAPGTVVPEGVDHVAMYLGKDFIVHASGKTKAVVVENLENNPLQKICIGARRIVLNKEKRFVVEVPRERLDIRIKEDLIEEIQRLSGLSEIKPMPLSILKNLENKPAKKVAVDKNLFYQDKIRGILADLSFSEVYTYSFVEKGEVELQNPIASNKAFLRDSLRPSLFGSVIHNDTNKDLLGLNKIKIFEIGNVFNSGNEVMALALGIKGQNSKEKVEDELKNVLNIIVEKLGGNSVVQMGSTSGPSLSVTQINLGKLIETLPEPAQFEEVDKKPKNIQYKKISLYPFVVRDIAVFVPKKIASKKVLEKIMKMAGPLVVTHNLFDVFTKKFPDGLEKTSYAFRLVFQSDDRTLTDNEINEIMAGVANELGREAGWQVR